MTQHHQLTDTAVRAKTKGPGYYLDGRGLYLQVAPGGSRSWLLRYTIRGKTREMGLGSLLDFGLARARDRAQQARDLLAQGIDPIDHRNKAQAAQVVAEAQAAQASVTFQACAEEYHKAHADNWKNVKHGAQWINTLKEYVFPKFGKLPIQQVGKAEVLKALTPIWKTKAETASRVFQRIRTVINYGAAKDYCTGVDGEFWAQVKLALGANDRARKVVHHSSCPYAQVGDLMSKVRASTATPMVQLAFEFIVLTASRSGEVRGARWSEFDAHLTHWTVPGERMKAGRDHKVPLSKRARAVLRQARALQAESVEAAADGKSLELVFPNPGGRPYSDMVFTQLLRRLELPYTMHGFRASFRTWGMEATQYPAEMLEFALAHVVGDQTVRAYARSDMVARRLQLMQDWADYVSAAL
ncbi:integrase [Variovorax sp. WS11]|uniref:tyrosine-type recombinase/integrase n=1 Tax=Variovorax sp. WS11 TaxID=1105204 RepID=UPI000D0D5F72|nr:integrase arm-type DNA-binding domain-containing protein [Variovorax sp. WS11]NDZ12695.1 integrase arm-type DNA-binding domain-containing protein [Variovorax sp. WS11]PSL84640.1 integrase [Variovorax sp. WS11]